MGVTDDAVRSAFDAATSWNEWATAVVVLGVGIELFALLFFSKDMPRNEKIALLIGSVLVVGGVAGEYVYGGRAASAAAELQRRADVKIASAKDQAATAMANVALTIAKYGDLDKFVREKTRSIEQGVGGLEARESALSNNLTRDETAIAKERDARRAMLEQEKPRTLTPAQIATIGDALKGKFKEITVTSLCDQDAISFANAIREAVRASGASPMILVRPDHSWCWDEWPVSASFNGLTVYESGPEIIGALVKAKLPSLGGAHSPNKQFEDAHIPTPTIFVGQKALPFQTFPEYELPPKFRAWVAKHPPPWNPK